MQDQSINSYPNSLFRFVLCSESHKFRMSLMKKDTAFKSKVLDTQSFFTCKDLVARC